MTDKRKALEPILDKVEKLFGMLGSDNREEIATAATKMIDVLKKAGLDLHDLWKLGWADKKEDIAALLAALLDKDIDVLLKIGKERASYFLNDEVFADVDVHGHRKCNPCVRYVLDCTPCVRHEIGNRSR